MRIITNKRSDRYEEFSGFMLNGKGWSGWKKGANVQLPEKGVLDFHMRELVCEDTMPWAAFTDAFKRIQQLRSPMERFQKVRSICEKHKLDGEQATLLLMVLDRADVEPGAFLILDASREKHQFLEACMLLSAPLTSLGDRKRQLSKKHAVRVFGQNMPAAGSARTMSPLPSLNPSAQTTSPPRT